MPVTLARLLRFILVLGVLATLAGCGTIMNSVRDGADDNLMLGGNDPVAYFTESRPVKGDPAIKATYHGLTYRFASQANKTAFERNPARYVPAYGGFCASGAPYALKARIGFETFKVVDDRLYFFGGPRSKRNWEMDEKINVEVGDAYWEKETKDVPFRWQNFKRYTFKVPGYKTDAELDAEYLKRFGNPAPSASPAKN
jgi:YHS domain-containing protein